MLKTVGLNQGPSFSTSLGTNQVVATGQTKVQLNTEQWDTNGAYDNATNYRFQPLVAGYYQVDFFANFGGLTNLPQASVWKNGANAGAGSIPATGYGSQVSTMVYLNGSTDYIEFYVYAGAGGGTVFNGAANTRASAAWIRS